MHGLIAAAAASCDRCGKWVASGSRNFYTVIFTLPPGVHRSNAISASVCLSVCLSTRISQKPHIQILRNCLLSVAMARSSSDDGATRYVLPLL